MKKILPVIIVLLVLAGAAFAYTRRPTSQAPKAPATQTTGQAASEAKEFADAVASGRPTICTMSKDSESMTYYVKGKMLKADITTAESKSHIINDTKYFYMWADGQKQGTKMNLAIPSPSPVGSVAPAPEQSTPKFENESDYDNLKNEGYTINCQAGSINDGDFVPPSDVTFTDLSAMFQSNAPSQGSQPQIDIEKLKQQYGAQ